MLRQFDIMNTGVRDRMAPAPRANVPWVRVGRSEMSVNIRFDARRLGDVDDIIRQTDGLDSIRAGELRDRTLLHERMRLHVMDLPKDGSKKSVAVGQRNVEKGLTIDMLARLKLGDGLTIKNPREIRDGMDQPSDSLGVP